MFRRSMPALIVLGLLSPALAQNVSRPASGIRVVTKTHLNQTQCTCRLSGQDLPVGSEICMQESLFRCQMDQNVTTWRPLASPCPQS